jgi:hypothetical protein
MSQVILQPSGNKDAREHYENTIESPVDSTVISQLVSTEEYQFLVDIYGDNSRIPTWGVTPGKKGVNKTKWDRIQVGDVTLFAANGQVFASGVVTYKLHNRELALELWGKNHEDQTWEYIYFLDEIKQQSIPYVDFNRAAGYADNNVIQGFAVMNEEKSEYVLSTFDLESEIYQPDVSEEEYREIVLNLNSNDNLDVPREGSGRKEQPFLRKHLFGRKKIGTCGICNHDFPVPLLVAAHIKKRSNCTNEEKLDYKNIVMPMCKFGCDDLYEKGYITVINGVVTKNPTKKLTERANEYIETVVGKMCLHWNSNTEEYFAWHAAKHRFQLR